jgi:thioredoxin-dependent adenylylsulfate APS reductase
MHNDNKNIVLDELEIGELAVEYEARDPQELIEWAIEKFGSKLAIITSFQSDGMVLLDMAYKINPGINVVTVDTGRLGEESYAFIDQVREHYGININVRYPDSTEVEKLVTINGANSFYKSVNKRLVCCQVRKVRPLQRALDGYDAWITGLRRDQWASRVNIRKIELDHDHGAIIKLNPLADWSEEEVEEYIALNNVPRHPLYALGYTSIGCKPCTRAINPGEDSRAGRWWWEKDAPKECGMHCSIETGGFEHELKALLGSEH